MSATLRISQSAVRHRLFHSRAVGAATLLHAQETQRRGFSWAPAAYRRQRSWSPPRKRKSGPNGAGGPSREDTLWKHLQEAYGDSKGDPESREIEKKKRDQRTSFGRYNQLAKLQDEGKALIGSYQKALFPDSKVATKHDDVIVFLTYLHEQCNSSSAHVVPSWESILKTEEQFRDIGGLVRELIVEFARMPSKENSEASLMAEELLRELIQLKTDRSQLVRMAEKDRLAKEQEQANSWTGWVKKVFLAPGEESDTKDQPQVMAHQDENFGPLKRQFQEVVRAIRRDAKEFEWQPEDYRLNPEETKVARDKLMKHADRMAAVVDLLPQHGITQTLSITGPVMETYTSIGSLESAMKAERIYVEICKERVPPHTFDLILRGYRLAALMEEKKEERVNAANCAQELLRNRVTANGESYSLVLQAIRNAGKEAIPDMISRSERLLIQLCGKDFFEKVVEHKELPPEGDLQVFESLACMYAESGGANHGNSIKKAKNIIACAEDRRKLESKNTRNKSNNDLPSASFPNVQVYNVILVGIIKEIRRIKKESGMSGDFHNLHQVIREEALYATSLLDRMVLAPASLPNHATFELILKVWAISKVPESGKRADEILSRWNMRRACSGPLGTTDNLGFEALRCWATSANASIPGVLQKALRILKKEEARSGTSLTPILPVRPYGDAENKILNDVYENREGALRQHYNATILVCSLCRDEPEAALEAAFDVYNRMIAAGIAPLEETFTSLIACCSNLLPEKSKRRYELASTVVAFARANGISSDNIINKMKKEKLRRSPAKSK